MTNHETALSHAEKIRRRLVHLARLLVEREYEAATRDTAEIANLGLELDHLTRRMASAQIRETLKPAPTDQPTIPGVEELKTDEKCEIDKRYK